MILAASKWAGGMRERRRKRWRLRAPARSSLAISSSSLTSALRVSLSLDLWLLPYYCCLLLCCRCGKGNVDIYVTTGAIVVLEKVNSQVLVEPEPGPTSRERSDKMCLALI